MKRSLECLAMVTVVCLGWGAAGSAGNGYAAETAGFTLQARDVLPASLLSGSNYTINPEVQNDGLINTYTMTTSYGAAKVESTSLLLMRIGELKAIEVMDEVDRKQVFGDAVVKGVKAPVQTVVELVQDPVETSKGIVAGAGRFFSNIGNAIVSEDPHQDNALKVALGYDVAKRQFAYEFNIDPYTDYTPVVDRLGEIARAAVAGGMTPKAVLVAANSDLATGLRISGTAKGLKELVRDKSPAELQKINRQKMAEMKVSSQTIEQFLGTYAYNPQERTLLVGELAVMQGVADREQFLARAATATEREVAVFFRIMAQMAARYHVSVAQVERFVALDNTLHVLTREGTVALLVPVDYLFWNERVEKKVIRIDEQIAALEVPGKKELWVTGKVDRKAREMLVARGWQVHEDVREKLLQ